MPETKSLDKFIEYGYSVAFHISEKTGCGSTEATEMIMTTKIDGSLTKAYFDGIPAEDMADQYIKINNSKLQSNEQD